MRVTGDITFNGRQADKAVKRRLGFVTQVRYPPCLNILAVENSKDIQGPESLLNLYAHKPKPIQRHTATNCKGRKPG